MNHISYMSMKYMIFSPKFKMATEKRDFYLKNRNWSMYVPRIGQIFRNFYLLRSYQGMELTKVLTTSNCLDFRAAWTNLNSPTGKKRHSKKRYIKDSMSLKSIQTTKTTIYHMSWHAKFNWKCFKGLLIIMTFENSKWRP